MKRPWLGGIVVASILAMVLSSCGGAAPTATPLPPTATTAMPTATAAMAATATPVRTAAAASPTPAPASDVPPEAAYPLAYPPDRVKKLLADNFLLAGMKYGAGKDPVYGGVPVLANRNDPPGLDPMLTGTTTLVHMTQSITGRRGTLVRAKLSNSFEAEGYMAKSWEATDNFKVWTFRLREDVKWHDGVGVTADDLKFIIDLANFPPAGRRRVQVGVFGPLEEVQVVDKYTVRLMLKASTPFLLQTMSDGGDYMTHPKHLAEPILKAGNVLVGFPDFGFVSVGPHKFSSFDKGSAMKVVRNPLYFEKDSKGRQLPYLDGITFPIIPDQSTIVSAFRAGRIDGTALGSGYHLSPSHVALIKKDVGAKTWFARGPTSAWGPQLNATSPPFNDLNLRKAVHLYAERDGGVELVWGGHAMVSGMGWPGSPWANPDLLTWPGFNPATKEQDKAEAKRLIQQSGYAGTKIEILSYDGYIHTGEFMQQQMRAMGLDPFIKVVDQNLSSELTAAGRYQAHVSPLVTANPSEVLAGFVTTNPLNGRKHGDTKVDELTTQFNALIDLKARQKAFFEAERYIMVEKYYYPVWYREEAVNAYRAHLKGVWVPGADLDETQYDEAWIDTSAR